VEVAAGGELSSLDRLRRALEVGPPGAQVERMEDLDSGAVTPLPYPFNIHR
jgi:hypothetical protein